MKNILRYSFLGLIAVTLSCNESEDLMTDGAKTGGIVEPASSSLNYVVGQPEGPYTLDFLVQQGTVKTTEIRLYKSFTTTQKYTVIEDGEEVEKSKTFVSNEVLERTLTAPEENAHVTTNFTFAELSNGLTIERLDGTTGPLPSNDGDLNVGDRWIFRIESVLSDGRVVQQDATIAATVSTRYAGTYKPIAGEYYRLGVLTTSLSGWPAEVSIESIDATTYRIIEYWGPFNANEVFFQIIGDQIIFPAKRPDGSDQLFNDQPMITCESNPADFIAAVNCGNTNFVINDDVNGKDKLVMTSGYYTPGSGPRVFYQVLEKIVD